MIEQVKAICIHKNGENDIIDEYIRDNSLNTALLVYKKCGDDRRHCIRYREQWVICSETECNKPVTDYIAQCRNDCRMRSTVTSCGNCDRQEAEAESEVPERNLQIGFQYYLQCDKHCKDGKVCDGQELFGV